jgi:arabinan endo-1,5-alpha-L-arabinosidase
MVIRRMYFVDGWPLFSPEPYAGEKEAVEKLSDKREMLDTEWEWVLFKVDNNTIARSIVSKLPVNVIPEKTYIFTAYDYENSRECSALSGITEVGEVVWAKK